MNREKYNEEYNGNWEKFLEDKGFQEVLIVARAMREKGSLTFDEVVNLLTPEEQCQMEDKVEYVTNVLRSLRLSDGLTWRGN